MPTIAAILGEAARRLAGVTETPRLDAELLLAHVLGYSRAQLMARGGEPVESPAFGEALARRLNHEPIAYITGHWEFFSIDFLSRAPVLVPRPETEHLVEAALAHLAGRPGARVLDLCTGTGCVAIAIARNVAGATVDAVDIQPHAVTLARENVERLGVAVSVYEGDLFSALPGGSGPYDVIVSNPPYIADAEYADLPEVIRRHEDPVALLAGADGLDVVRRILRDGLDYVVPGGLLAMELGETQAGAVGEIASELGWHEIGVIRDLGGHERVVTARR